MDLHTLQEFARVIDENITEMTMGLPEQLNLAYRQLATVVPSDRNAEEYFDISGLPDIPQFYGIMQYISAAPGYHRQIEPGEFGAITALQHKLIKDKKFAVLDNMVVELRKSNERTKDKRFAEIFTRATNAAYSFMQDEEGVSLGSNSHTTKAQGVSTASGFDNLLTGALSKSNLATARVQFHGFKDHQGERLEVNPDMLIVPRALEDTAKEILQTQSGLDTAHGNINPHQNRQTLFVYDRLDDSDSNDWFLVDSRLMKMLLLFIEREDANTMTWADPKTMTVQHRLYSRWGFGSRDWRWILVNNVT